MLRNRRAVILIIASVAAVSTAGVAYQTYRVAELQRQLDAVAKARTRGPTIPIPAESTTQPPFVKTVRKTIPDIYWGEFAQDVHDCGTAQSFVVTDRKLMVQGSEEEEVEQVRWTKPKLIALTTRDSNFLERSYEMELSPDSNEITFIFTNMKVIRQRCSARAHEGPSEPLVEDVDMNMYVDTNTTDVTDSL